MFHIYLPINYYLLVGPVRQEVQRFSRPVWGVSVAGSDDSIAYKCVYLVYVGYI